MTYISMNQGMAAAYGFASQWFGGTFGVIIAAGVVAAVAFGLLSWVRR